MVVWVETHVLVHKVCGLIPKDVYNEIFCVDGIRVLVKAGHNYPSHLSLAYPRTPSSTPLISEGANLSMLVEFGK